MEKSSGKLNKNKKSGPKQKNQTAQVQIITCLAGKEMHRIAKNVKVLFGEQELLQAAEWWRNYWATDPTIRSASFFQGKLPQLLCLSLRLLSMTFVVVTEGKKRGLQGFQIFCSTKVLLAYMALSILSFKIEISLFYKGISLATRIGLQSDIVIL